MREQGRKGDSKAGAGRSGRRGAAQEEERWVGEGDEPVGTSSRVQSIDVSSGSADKARVGEAKRKVEADTASAEAKDQTEDLRAQLKQSREKGSVQTGQIVIRTAGGAVLVQQGKPAASSEEDDEDEEAERSGRRARKRGGKKSKKSKKSRSSKRRKQHGE